jgi:ribonuclease HI
MRHLAWFVENGCGIISAKGDCKMIADEILDQWKNKNNTTEPLKSSDAIKNECQEIGDNEMTNEELIALVKKLEAEKAKLQAENAELHAQRNRDGMVSHPTNCDAIENHTLQLTDKMYARCERLCNDLRDEINNGGV